MAAKKRTARKSTPKKTGRAARTKGGAEKMPRSTKQWAAAITERERRRPGWFREVVQHLKFATASAQAEPRASAH